MTERIERIDRAVTDWLARRSVLILRVALGIVFLWFGALKLFPGLSPAEGLIGKTVAGIVDVEWFIPVLATWECVIGLGLLLNRFLRITLLLLGAHMVGTFLPLVTCPNEVWTKFPYAWTLEGQYILKNFVLIGAGLTLVGSLRRSKLPESAERGNNAERATCPTSASSPPRKIAPCKPVRTTRPAARC